MNDLCSVLSYLRDIEQTKAVHHSHFKNSAKINIWNWCDSEIHSSLRSLRKMLHVSMFLFCVILPLEKSTSFHDGWQSVSGINATLFTHFRHSNHTLRRDGFCFVEVHSKMNRNKFLFLHSNGTDETRFGIFHVSGWEIQIEWYQESDIQSSIKIKIMAYLSEWNLNCRKRSRMKWIEGSVWESRECISLTISLLITTHAWITFMLVMNGIKLANLTSSETCSRKGCSWEWFNPISLLLLTFNSTWVFLKSYSEGCWISPIHNKPSVGNFANLNSVRNRHKTCIDRPQTASEQSQQMFDPNTPSIQRLCVCRARDSRSGQTVWLSWTSRSLPWQGSIPWTHYSHSRLACFSSISISVVHLVSHSLLNVDRSATEAIFHQKMQNMMTIWV
jgi:hypothetical protein